MNFKITQESNLGLEKTALVNKFSQEIKNYLQKREYGQDIEDIYIGLICVKPEFEPFFKQRKPKYSKKEISNNLGIEIVSTNEFVYDIKLDYNIVINLDEKSFIGLLASKIVESLKNFDSLPKGIKHFDKDQFKLDLEGFFYTKKYI